MKTSTIVAHACVLAWLAGCGADSETEPESMNSATDPRDDIPGRFCEIFLGYPAETAGRVDFEIWGSQSLGSCPQADWDALDFDAIQAEYSALAVLPNGPRAILTDFGGGVAFGENVRSFGAIDMQIVSYLRDFDPSTGRGKSSLLRFAGRSGRDEGFQCRSGGLRDRHRRGQGLQLGHDRPQRRFFFGGTPRIGYETKESARRLGLASHSLG